MEETNFIKVYKARREGYVFTRVSSQDYSDPKIANHKWRLSESGYAVRSWKYGNKVYTEYLHKVICGESCYHINGDRLDNRRSNLKKCQSVIKNDDSLEVITKDDANQQDQLPFKENEITDEGMACIAYGNLKQYAGRVDLNDNNKPHGIGILTMNSNKQLLGSWIHGNLHTGIIVNFDSREIYQDMAALLCPMKPISIEIVDEGLITKTIHL